MSDYYRPTYKAREYHCPYCYVYAKQDLYKILRCDVENEDKILPSYDNSPYSNPNTSASIPKSFIN
jgi:hypothetical protein